MVDLIRFPYKGVMRAFDGSTFRVQWVILKDDVADLEFATPFRSSRNDDFKPFDTGAVGEIPEYYPERSDIEEVPESVCRVCSIGIREWWESGWPSDAPPVTLDPQGFATGCTNPVPPVTSVGLAMPPQFVVTGSPVTGIGVLSADWDDIPEGKFLGRPAGVGSGQPDFYDLPDPGPVKMLGRITAGPLYNSNLTMFAVTGNTSAGSDTVTGVPSIAFDNIERFMQINTPAFSLGTNVIAFDPAAQTLTVSENALTTGPITFDLVPLSYEWFETEPGSTTSASHAKPGGIVGTLASNPAKNVLGPGLTDLTGADVEIWFRNTASGIDIYEFQLIGIADAQKGMELGGPLTTPTVTTPPGTPPANPPAGSFYVDVSGNFVFVNLDLSVTIIAGPNIAVGSKWIFGQCDWTQPVVTIVQASGNKDVLNILKPGALPSTPIDPIGGYAVLRCLYHTSHDWQSSNGPADVVALDPTAGHPQNTLSVGTNVTFGTGYWKEIRGPANTVISQFTTEFPQYRLYGLLGNTPVTPTWTQGHTDFAFEVLKLS